MKKATLLGLGLTILTPVIASASSCAEIGYSVVYVNGVETSEADALKDSQKLLDKLGYEFAGQSLAVRLGYNASHIDGFGDIFESVAQTFNKSISNFDRDTILNQIHSQVNTQKILLVGHSQGTFFTNAIYAYLTSHGVPKESIGVYNLATPASYVAGSGTYLTSANDPLVYKVRQYDASVGAPQPLSANILIPIPQGENKKWAGHYFQSDYLNGAPDRIVSDIQKALSKLNARGTEENSDGCFVPPGEGMAYKAQSLAFKAADPTMHGIDTATVVSARATAAMAMAANSALNALASTAFHKVVPTPTVQTATAAFGLESALYGSSLSKNEYKALLAGTDFEAASEVDAKARDQETLKKINKNHAAISGSSVVNTDGSARAAPRPAPQVDVATEVKPVIKKEIPIPHFGTLATPISPGFGGGSSIVPITIVAAPSPSSAPIQQRVVPSTFTITSPVDNALVNSMAITFAGTADPAAIITALFNSSSASSTADQSGNWSLVIDLQEGTTVLNLIANNSTATSSALQRTVVVDRTPPTDVPIISASSCDTSLSNNFCLIPAQSAHVAWSVVADASYYGITANGSVVATTTGVELSAPVSIDATTTLRIVAYDAAGNATSSASIDVRTVSQTLIINEIGWGGNDISPTNQWIELKNVSPYTLAMSHLTIERSNGAAIALSGAVPSGGYVAVQRTAFSGIGPSIIVPFDSFAASSAEQLSLSWHNGTATKTLDATPATNTCIGWCAGAANASISANQAFGTLESPLSMERKSDTSDGSLAVSWRSTDTYGFYEWGTPGAANSTGLPLGGVYCGSQSNLAIANQSYNPGSGDCDILSKFVRRILSGNPNRAFGLFRGDVGSSTTLIIDVFGPTTYTRAINFNQYSPQPGEHFVFALWEQPTGPNFNNVTTWFGEYFASSALPSSTVLNPPYNNYIAIPFTYQP